VLETLVPELQPAGDGDDTHRVGPGLQEADVVGDDQVPAALEAGGEGGLAGAGVAEKCGDVARALDRAAVQREQAVLMAENAEDGAEQIGGDIGGRSAGDDLDTDFAAVANVVARYAGDIEQIFRGRDLTVLVDLGGAGDGVGDASKPDGDGDLARARRCVELAYVELRLETKRAEIEDAWGWGCGLAGGHGTFPYLHMLTQRGGDGLTPALEPTFRGPSPGVVQ